jgi:DNA-binding LacI/PurR family transcriptional regulator
LLLERRVDGLLIATILVSDSFVEELRDEGVPFVVLNRRVRGVDACVSVDDELGVRAGVEHLAKLGHARIGYVAGPIPVDPARRRLAGYKAGLRASGVAYAPELVARCDVEDETVFRATLDLLAVRPRPTALVVWSPRAAIPALAAARRSGLTLPEELSVLAYSESPTARYLEPPLTTVSMPLAEMSQSGVSSLLRLIDGEEPRPMVVSTPPSIIERGSTGVRTGARRQVDRGYI